MSILIFVAIGLTAGLLSGMFGIGGGIVIVPMLILIAKMQPQVASGTSLGVFVLPVGLLGALAYYRAGNIDVRATLIIAAGVFVGGYFGAQIAQVVSGLVLKRAFALLLVFVAARLWLSGK